MTTQKGRVNMAVIALIVAAIAVIGYFTMVVGQPDLNQMQPAAGEQPLSQTQAQFRAECTLPDGARASGTVSLDSQLAPESQPSVPFRQEGAVADVTITNPGQNCTFAPY